MNVAAGIARICLYDLHFAPSPLRTPGLLKPQVSMLGAPDQYESVQENSWRLDVGRLMLRSFDARHRWSHFWNGYQTLCATEGHGQTFPRFHMPLEVGLRETSFVAALPPPFGRVPMRARLLLWPYGWSTHLELALAVPAGLPSLGEVSRTLHHDPVIEIHSVQGLVAGPQTLSATFRQITTWLQAELFTGIIGEKRPVSRRAVIALSAFAGDRFTYEADIDPELPRLPTADRARLHSILLGRSVSLQELIEREASQGIAVTGLHASGFVVTDFNAGSLVLLHEAAPRTGKGKTAAKCLWRNTTAMFTTTGALMAAHRGLRSEPPNWMNQSADWSLRILRAIPNYYESPVCRQLYSYHGEMRRLLS